MAPILVDYAMLPPGAAGLPVSLSPSIPRWGQAWLRTGTGQQTVLTKSGHLQASSGHGPSLRDALFHGPFRDPNPLSSEDLASKLRGGRGVLSP